MRGTIHRVSFKNSAGDKQGDEVSPRHPHHGGGMPRTKRSRLARVTAQDRMESPECIRSTPNGGWAWKCHYCGRYACDQSVKGIYLCRCHGGSTPRQRSPEEDGRRRLGGLARLRTPGRPLKHGFYARVPSVKVADILEAARLRNDALARLVKAEVRQARREYLHWQRG